MHTILTFISLVLANCAVAGLNYFFNKKSYKVIGLKVLFSHIFMTIAGALFFIHINNSELSAVLALDLLIFAVFVYLAVFDIHFLEIPLLPVLALVMLGAIRGLVNFLPGMEIDYYWLAGLLLPVALIFVISKTYKRQVFGEGDYFIILAMGFTLNAVGILVALEMSVIIGAVGGIVLAAIKKTSIRKLLIPMVPVLLIGWAIGLALGGEIWNFLFVA